MKKVLLAAVLMGITLTACNENKQTTNEESMNTTLNLTQDWDKVFPKSDKVDHKKVTFKNRYGIEPMAHSIKISNVMREDEVKQDFTREEMLQNAPEEEDGFFKVPKIN